MDNHLIDQVNQLIEADKNRPRTFSIPVTKPVYTGLPPNHPDALKIIGSKTILQTCTEAEFNAYFADDKPRKTRLTTRLVRGAKSPTELSEDEKQRIRNEFSPHSIALNTGAFLRAGGKNETVIEEKENDEVVANGTRLVISKRDWSLEYRIRLESEVSTSQTPPEQAGERKTKNLTRRAVRKILDSGIYTGTHRGGFTTFVTLTFNANSRKLVENGTIHPQKEISRFLEALQKMFQRGWVPEWKQEKFKKYPWGRVYSVEQAEGKIQAEYWQKQYPWGEVVSVGKTEYSEGLQHQKLDYIWVIEKPKNKQGEDNLHFHLLMRWDVPKEYFHAWANRLERIWGHGFVHLERMKTSEASIDYLLKAIGYTTKGEESEQGEISGNRYGISKTARAPEWEAVSSYEWGCMGYLFGMVEDRIKSNRAKALNDLKGARAALKHAPKKKTNKNIRHRLRVEASLAKKKYEQVYKGKNVITFKGESIFNQFIRWAENKGYSKNKAPSRLWLAEFSRRLRLKTEYAVFKFKSFVCDHEWHSILKQFLPKSEKEPPSYQVVDGYCVAF